QVSHFTYQDDVRVLAKGAAQGVREGPGILPNLALVDNAEAVRVQILDWVLDRDDVDAALGVDLVDHGRERGRLSGTGRTGNENQASRQAAELFQYRRQTELLERRDTGRDHPEGHGN